MLEPSAGYVPLPQRPLRSGSWVEIRLVVAELLREGHIARFTTTILG